MKDFIGTMISIDEQVEELYQKMKSKCATYEELDKEIKQKLFTPAGKNGITKEFLIDSLREKMEEEKSRLPIR